MKKDLIDFFKKWKIKHGSGLSDQGTAFHFNEMLQSLGKEKIDHEKISELIEELYQEGFLKLITNSFDINKIPLYISNDIYDISKKLSKFDNRTGIFENATSDPIEILKELNRDEATYKLNDDGSVDVFGTLNLINRNLSEIPVKIRKVHGSVNITSNKFKDLKSMPLEIQNDLIMNSNMISSLEGCPEKINGDFFVRWNRLTSLEHGPKFVKYEYECTNNALETLEYLPEHVGGNFTFYNSPSFGNAFKKYSQKALQQLQMHANKSYEKFLMYKDLLLNDKLKNFNKSGIFEMKHVKAFEHWTDDFNGSFWGKAGAGVLVICTKTNRMLLGLRSENVEEPGTLGIFGGKVDDREKNFEKVALRELYEETGYDGNIKMIPAYVYKTTGKIKFEYHNFIGLVEEEFKPILDWENEDAFWMTYEEALNQPNLHFGLEKLLSVIEDYYPEIVSLS